MAYTEREDLLLSIINYSQCTLLEVGKIMAEQFGKDSYEYKVIRESFDQVESYKKSIDNLMVMQETSFNNIKN